MTGQTRRLLYMALAAVILICAVLVIRFVRRGGSEQESESQTEAAPAETAVTVRVENQSGGFEIYLSDGEYVILGAEDFETYSERVENVLWLASSPEYTEIDSRALRDMAEYGLDEPYANLTAEYDGGESLSFSIGSEVPNGSGERYFRFADDNDVYTVSSQYGELMGFSYTDLISPVVVEGDENAGISDVRLSGKKRSTDIAIRPSGSARYDFMIYEPLTAPTNQYTGDEAANLAVNGLTAVTVLAADPDAETVASYGLDDPEYTVEYTADGRTVKLNFSELEDTAGMYACMAGTGRLIYMVDVASAEWIDAPLSDLVYEYIFEADISQVDSLFCTLDGETYEFRLVHENGKVTKAVCDGYGEIEAESFEQFFDTMTDVDWTGEMGGSAAAEAYELSFTVRYLPEAGRESDTVAYSRMSELRYSISVNGAAYFYTDYADVNGKRLALTELLGIK